MKTSFNAKKPALSLTPEVKTYLKTSSTLLKTAPFLVRVDDTLAGKFGWTTVKSATRVIRKHPEAFFANAACRTYPHPSIPKAIVYELTADGFKALMRHAHDPAMRSKDALDFFERCLCGVGDQEGNNDDANVFDEDDDSLDSEESSVEGDDNDVPSLEMPVAKRRKVDTSQITEETIAAVMDQLADNAHKVQAAHPECKFPVGVSAKTMAALGWEGEYRENLRKLKENNRYLRHDRDFQVRTGQRVPRDTLICSVRYGRTFQLT
jgi:hypothetical protein